MGKINKEFQWRMQGILHAREVVEKDGAYKVISKLFDTKEKAKAVLNEMDASLGAFVTTIK